MRAGTEPTLFETLDECHRQTGLRLKDLAQVAARLQAGGLDDPLRQEAAAVESFFSSVSRAHHEQEERAVFPPLLAVGNPALTHTVRSLQDEHAWIQAHWAGLAARLRALASGDVPFDVEEFVADVRKHVERLKAHMELEDTVIYPQSRVHWTRAAAARVPGGTTPAP